MNWPLTPKNAILKDRSDQLLQARTFFSKRGLIEVDCPIISSSASVDAHIDLIPVLDSNNSLRYLHSSPEYGIKRLLAEGLGDCYQLSHVFRQGEYGHKHNPEFMMAEWYRLGFTFEQLIEETVDFVKLFLGDLPCEILSYREAFKRYAGFDYVHMNNDQLLDHLKKLHIDVYPHIIEEGREALLNLILGIQIEPQLGKNEFCVLAYYPSTQAALAKTKQHLDEKVAERFEIYYKGIELANGYHELTDPAEQRRRLMQANIERQRLGKSSLPIDENFLQALEQGLPDCCGVAVGFDRLMMLRHKTNNMSEVIAFDWSQA
jgi:lysyl-tRNA synthetase class 2